MCVCGSVCVEVVIQHSVTGERMAGRDRGGESYEGMCVCAERCVVVSQLHGAKVCVWSYLHTTQGMPELTRKKKLGVMSPYVWH